MLHYSSFFLKLLLSLLFLNIFITNDPTVGAVQNLSDTPHYRLASHLMTQSAFRIRPVLDHRKATIVATGATLYQLLGVDEVNQRITTNIWMTETWEDDFLVWNPEDYEGIESILLPPSELWRPDTYLYNNLEMAEDASIRLMGVTVRTNYSAGRSRVTLTAPAIFRTSCEMDIANFPFDRQHCTLRFGSWTHNGAEINYIVHNRSTSLDYFLGSQEWDILEFTATRTESKFECCEGWFPIVKFLLIIQRKPLFYTINLIIPSVITAFINFIGFFSPTSSSGERGEKVSLGLTTLLALGVLLLQLADHTPHSSTTVSLVGWYILLLLILVGVSTVMTVVIIRLQYKGECGHKSTRSLSKFLHCTAWIVGFTYQRKSFQDESSETEHLSLTKEDRIPLQQILGLHKPSTTARGGISAQRPSASACPTPPDSPSMISAARLEHDLRRIEVLLKKIANEGSDSHDVSPETKSDWILAASVLERFCLIISVGCTILLTFWLCMKGYSSLQAAEDHGNHDHSQSMRFG